MFSKEKRSTQQKTLAYQPFLFAITCPSLNTQEKAELVGDTSQEQCTSAPAWGLEETRQRSSIP
jgi:hypothetical protein